MSLRPPRRLPQTKTDIPMRDLISKYKVFFLDSYGVLRGRTGIFPGAERTIGEILSQGKILGVASNTTADMPGAIQSDWKEKGINIPLELIFTSGMVLKSFVAKNNFVGSSAIVIGPEVSQQYAIQAGLNPIPKEEVMERYNEANLVVICENPFDGSSIMLDAAASAILVNRTRAVLTTTDRFVPFFNRTASAGVSVGVMATAAILKALTGADPEIIGKPAQGMFNMLKLALKEMGYDVGDVLFVGDNLYEDITGAVIAGFDCLLVESGISGAVARGEITGPIADLDRAILAQRIRPTYQLPSLIIPLE